MKSLVTVKTPEEAANIADTPPDIIDIKNPGEGSLGAQPAHRIERIMDAAPSTASTSIAVGDVPHLPGTVSLAVHGALQYNPDYIKVGLKGPETIEDAIELLRAASEGLNGSSTKLVAGGYADHKRFNSVNPVDLPTIATKSGADAVMIDTAEKDGKTLFDHTEPQTLQEIVEEAKQQNLTTAAAGSLDIEQVGKIRDIGFDIFGVRGAVCTGTDREASLDPEIVREMLGRLDQ
ncbi:MAG: (5-formylfuran-3-yl)methyl phosphate synthase [Candidatus Nanohaloarchaea archaeon]|nr:(5-formylfuran-3-yl)methyl phosphate synthase [Candidatus Nanohaloarchaea archaeon]